ncbi:MAG: amidase domain-containing protein [Bacillota bacterium]|nr:amidase domain-containing protein [Bacillota bacterium]
MKKNLFAITTILMLCFYFSAGAWAEEPGSSGLTPVLEVASDSDLSEASGTANLSYDADLSATKYTPTKATTYANQWALSHNPFYKSYVGSGNDCTNFISQCIAKGGIPQDYTWRYTLHFDAAGNHVPMFDVDTNAWSEANDFKNWLTKYAVKVGSWSRKGTPAPYKTYSYLGADNSNNINGSGRYIVFYDWSGDGYMDHVSICVATGNSQDSADGSVYGDLIDQHSNARYKAIWHGDKRNNQKYTTRIYAFKVTY